MKRMRSSRDPPEAVEIDEDELYYASIAVRERLEEIERNAVPEDDKSSKSVLRDNRIQRRALLETGKITAIRCPSYFSNVVASGIVPCVGQSVSVRDLAVYEADLQRNGLKEFTELIFDLSDALILDMDDSLSSCTIVVIDSATIRSSKTTTKIIEELQKANIIRSNDSPIAALKSNSSSSRLLSSSPPSSQTFSEPNFSVSNPLAGRTLGKPRKDVIVSPTFVDISSRFTQNPEDNVTRQWRIGYNASKSRFNDKTPPLMPQNLSNNIVNLKSPPSSKTLSVLPMDGSSKLSPSLSNLAPPSQTASQPSLVGLSVKPLPLPPPMPPRFNSSPDIHSAVVDLVSDSDSSNEQEGGGSLEPGDSEEMERRRLEEALRLKRSKYDYREYRRRLPVLLNLKAISEKDYVDGHSVLCTYTTEPFVEAAEPELGTEVEISPLDRVSRPASPASDRFVTRDNPHSTGRTRTRTRVASQSGGYSNDDFVFFYKPSLSSVESRRRRSHNRGALSDSQTANRSKSDAKLSVNLKLRVAGGENFLSVNPQRQLRVAPSHLDPMRNPIDLEDSFSTSTHILEHEFASPVKLRRLDTGSLHSGVANEPTKPMDLAGKQDAPSREGGAPIPLPLPQSSSTPRPLPLPLPRPSLPLPQSMPHNRLSQKGPGAQSPQFQVDNPMFTNKMKNESLPSDAPAPPRQSGFSSLFDMASKISKGFTIIQRIIPGSDTGGNNSQLGKSQEASITDVNVGDTSGSHIDIGLGRRIDASSNFEVSNPLRDGTRYRVVHRPRKYSDE